MRMFLKTGFWTMLARLFFTLGNVLLLAWVARLGSEVLGRFVLAYAFYQVLSILTCLGLPYLLAREVAARTLDGRSLPAELPREVGLALLYGGLGGTLLLSALSPWLFPGLAWGVKGLAVLCGLLWGLDLNVGGLLLGQNRMRRESLAQGLGLAVLLAGCLLGVATLEGVLLARALSHLLCLLAKMPGLSWRAFAVSAGSRRLTLWGEGRYYGLSMLGDYLYRQADVLLLAHLLAAEVLGPYALGIRIYFLSAWLGEVLSTASTPFLARTWVREGKRGLLRQGKRLTTLLVPLGLLVAGGLLLARPLLLPLFHQESGGMVARIMGFVLPAVVLRHVNMIWGSLLTIGGRVRTRFWLENLTCWSFLLLSVPVVRWASVQGALVMRWLVELVLLVLMGHQLWRWLRSGTGTPPSEDAPVVSS